MKNKKFVLIDEMKYSSYTNMDFVEGYEFNPKNNIRYSKIAIKKVIIFNRDFIQMILKKKIQKRLDFYVKSLLLTIEEEDSHAAPKALEDIDRLRSILYNKYYKFLDESYYQLLVNKIENFYRKLEEKQLAFYAKDEKTYEEAEKAK